MYMYLSENDMHTIHVQYVMCMYCTCTYIVHVLYMQMLYTYSTCTYSRFYVLLMCSTYMYLSSVLQFGCWKNSTSDCNHFSINRNTKILYIWVSVKISPSDLHVVKKEAYSWIHMNMYYYSTCTCTCIPNVYCYHPVNVHVQCVVNVDFLK